jgi:hypothetical protein
MQGTSRIISESKATEVKNFRKGHKVKLIRELGTNE